MRLSLKGCVRETRAAGREEPEGNGDANEKAFIYLYLRSGRMLALSLAPFLHASLPKLYVLLRRKMLYATMQYRTDVDR